MRAKLFILLMAAALVWSGCGVGGGLKPTTVQTASEEGDKILNDVESALQEMDWEKLQQLLDDETLLNDDIYDKDDLDQLRHFFGDFDSIEDAQIIQKTDESVASEDQILISADLYLRLVSGDEIREDISDIYILVERKGDKWSGEYWVITEMQRAIGERQLAVDKDDLLARFAQVIQTKTFSDLYHLLAYRINVNYATGSLFGPPSSFIVQLRSDFSDITMEAFQLVSREYVDSGDIVNATALVEAKAVTPDGVVETPVVLRLRMNDTGDGWEIVYIEYKSPAFGLL